VVNLTEYDPCYLNTREESEVNGKKSYIFGLRPEQEAVMKKAMYHLVSSPTLQVLTIALCYGVYNYEDFDLSIHDIRSGIIFDQLPKSL
jgi:hypothetical protein